MGAQLDPLRVLQFKVNLLFEELVPKTKKTHFNTKWNEILGNMLDQAIEQASMLRLQIPGPSESKLLIPDSAKLPTTGALASGS